MKQFYLLTKTLLVVVSLLVGGANSAWGDTTIGGKGKDSDPEKWYGWGDSDGHKMVSVLAANKTLTLTFTVTDYSGEWAGYVVNLTKTNATSFGGDNGYVWFRSPDFAWYKTGWSTGAVVSNTNTIGDMSKSDWQAFVKGATTVMAIQRLGTQVFIKTTVTKEATSYTHYFVQEIGTTNDIYAFLCADAASISISDATITDTETVESTTATIGALNNDGDFAATPLTTLAPESMLNMHFTNHSAKGAGYQNYGIELVYDGNYADIVLGGGRWGTLLVDAEGDPVTTPVTNDEKTFNSFGDNFQNKMDGADVSLTIARSGRVVIITAVHTPSDAGTPFVLKYTIEPNATAFPDFATDDIQVKLTTDHSHITYNFPISVVNAEVTKYGWATFSSPYKLDFSSVSVLEAYAVTGYSGTAITKSDALGVVAANAGVLLKGTEGTTSTFYNIPVSTGEAYAGTNLMVAGTGATVSAEEGKTKYVLGVSASDEAEFQKIVGTAATVAAGKAYLQFNKVISDARALRMSFGDETAVENVKAAAETAKKNGAYLENGKIAIYKNGVKFNVAGQQMK